MIFGFSVKICLKNSYSALKTPQASVINSFLNFDCFSLRLRSSVHNYYQSSYQFCLFHYQYVSTTLIVFFTQTRSGKLIFSPFVNVLLTKSMLYHTHSSVNFTWFARFSQQKFNDRPLFKP